jgi:hypothetical protein
MSMLVETCSFFPLGMSSSKWRGIKVGGEIVCDVVGVGHPATMNAAHQSGGTT